MGFDTVPAALVLVVIMSSGGSVCIIPAQLEALVYYSVATHKHVGRTSLLCAIHYCSIRLSQVPLVEIQ